MVAQTAAAAEAEPAPRRPRPTPAPRQADDAVDSDLMKRLALSAAVTQTSVLPRIDDDLVDEAPEIHERPEIHAQPVPRSSSPATRSSLDHTIDALVSLIPGPFRRPLAAIGGMYSMFAASLWVLAKDIVRGKFNLGEFLDRSWFLVSVVALPIVLVSTPLGVAIALQVGSLAGQVGATSFVGAADAVGVLREASPIITALLLAGVGGSAVCAELGARTIREEIDAMVVLGINPLQRLVAPLMAAGVFVAMFLNTIVIMVSIFAAYVFDLAILHGTKGSFFGSFSQFATLSDFIASEIKAGIFGLTAVLIAAYKGLNTKRGPTGVGEAVNQSVVITGIVLFALNLIMTEIFFALVPQTTF